MTHVAKLGEPERGALQEVRPGRVLHVASRNTGSDITLFFVHGGGGGKMQWRNQWQHFSAGRVNLVAWDAVGHGRSPRQKLAAGYGGQALLADAQAVFAMHHTGHNIIVAHSYGARLALSWLLAEATRHQGPRVDAAVLLGAPPLGPMSGRRLFPGWLGRLPLPLLELARPLLARAFRRLAWHPDADPALVAFEQAATRGNTLFMMQAPLAAAPQIDEAALRHLPQPVSILAGEDDGLVPDAASARLERLLAHSTLRRVPRCGHQIMLEAPEATNAAIDEVLTRLRTTVPG